MKTKGILHTHSSFTSGTEGEPGEMIHESLGYLSGPLHPETRSEPVPVRGRS